MKSRLEQMQESYNIAHCCGEYSLFRIVPSDADSMRFLPKLHIRALEFLQKYGAETDPLWLSALLLDTLKKTPNFVHALVAINASDLIVAHAISYIELQGSLGAIAQQLQVEQERFILPEARIEIRDLGFRLMKEWAAAVGVKTFLTTALTTAHVRYNQRGGFRHYRTVMRLDLE